MIFSRTLHSPLISTVSFRTTHLTVKRSIPPKVSSVYSIFNNSSFSKIHSTFFSSSKPPFECTINKIGKMIFLLNGLFLASVSIAVDEEDAISTKTATSSKAVDQNEIHKLKIEIIENIDSELLEKIGRLRFKVYQQDNFIRTDLMPSGIWLDNDDYSGIHAVIKDKEGAVVAAVRLSLHSNLKDAPEGQLYLERGYPSQGSVAYFGKFVVDTELQKKGLGKRLVKSLMQIAKEKGAKCAILTTSEKLIDCFWKKQGFFDTGIRASYPESRWPYTVFAGCIIYFN